MDTRHHFGSDMGIHDPGTSSMEFSFTELEKVINFLLEDYEDTPGVSYSTLLSQPQGLPRFFVEDKSNYFSKVSTNIMEAKKSFLQYCDDTNKNIEDMTRQIIRSVKAREKKLKAQLQDLKAEKVAKWDEQLAICRKALENLKCQIAPFGNKNGLTSYYENLNKSLDFVDPGEVKFEFQNYSELVKSIQTVGRITQNVSLDDGTRGLNGTTPKFVFGAAGEEPGQFCRSWGICTDATGRILVCDRSNHRVQIFNECGQFLIQFGKEGVQPGEFNRPTGIDVDDKCRIIVADKDNHRIQVFSYSGCYLFSFGSKGTRPGQFMYPWDVSTNKDCAIAVSDSKNNRIQLFNDKGVFTAIFDAQILGIRNPRMALKYLDSPRGLAFRSDGCLLVTDFNNHRVLLLNEGFTKASTFGSEGSEPRQFFRPQGIACDKSGRFAVSDSKNYRVQIFDAHGNLLRAFGAQGDEPGHFDCPQGICFHPNENVLVVDLNNNRVQVF